LTSNEASQLLKNYLYTQCISYQLLLPYSHRRNAAERAIRSFKDNLIYGIYSTDKAFPMHLWDIFLPHAVITLNMLITLRLNPKLSASTHSGVQYYYNMAPIAPIAPLGKIIIAHETKNHRRTWAPRFWSIIDATQCTQPKPEVNEL
jgi:hypothetical protein